jgi:hypothetical protein
MQACGECLCARLFYRTAVLLLLLDVWMGVPGGHNQVSQGVAWQSMKFCRDDADVYFGYFSASFGPTEHCEAETVDRSFLKNRTSAAMQAFAGSCLTG